MEMQNSEKQLLPKEMLEELDFAVVAFDPVTKQLLYANRVGHAMIDDTGSLHHTCYQRLFSDTVELCPAYRNIALDIPNRRKFELDFTKILAEDRQGSLVLMNLKGFHKINVEYSFEQANNVLAGIAAYLRDQLPIKNAVYHSNSDKFLFLLPEVSEEVLKNFLYKLSSSFEEPWNVGGVHYPITCDIAAISFPEHGRSLHEVMENISTALEVSRKSNISNTITYFSRGIEEKIKERAELEWAMVRAISENYEEFEVYFQPILDSKTLKWAGCEALLRWNSKEFGFLGPNKFLPVAERTGLINALGNFVLNRSIQFVQELDLPENYPFHLSINLSAKQFYDMSLVADIKKALLETGFPPAELILELGDLKEKDKENPIVLKNLHDMKNLNSGVALDDFGLDDSGIYDFSGQRGILKIGRDITAGIETDEFMQTFMKTVIDLSKVMNLDVCAKGIETEGQFDMMKQYHCTYLQGYYFSRPITAGMFKDLLKDNI